MIIWKGAKKGILKNQTSFCDKTHNTLQIADNFLNPANGIYKKCIANILNGERLDVFPLRLGTIQGCLLFPPLFIIVLEVLAMTGKKKKEKERKGIQIGKARSKTIFIHRWHDFI